MNDENTAPETDDIEFPCLDDELLDTPMGLNDDSPDFDEPYDIDSDAGYDPYTGGPEDDGYDTGNDPYDCGYDDC